MMFPFRLPNYLREPPAFFHSRILVGAGDFLKPAFVEHHGITHVINCSHDDFSPVWWRTKFPTKYKLIPAIDSVNVNILDWYLEFETTLQAFLRESDGMVYVHCQAGMNRSASLSLVYTCKNLGMNIDQLIASVRRQRPCILQNPVFMNQVREFINGRVQDSQDTRQCLFRSNYRYAGFLTSGDRPESQGHQDQARSPPGRIERT